MTPGRGWTKSARGALVVLMTRDPDPVLRPHPYTGVGTEDGVAWESLRALFILSVATDWTRGGVA